MSFATLNEKTHAAPIKKDLVSWCPTMDLVAMVTDSDEVSIYRLNGQRVWATSPQAAYSHHSATSSLTFRPDGKVLAVGYENGDLIYLDINDGKTIDAILGVHEENSRAITLLCWKEGMAKMSSETSVSCVHSLSTHYADTLKDAIQTRCEDCVVTSVSTPEWQHVCLFALDTSLAYSNSERMYTSVQSIQTLIHDLEKETDLVKLMAVGLHGNQFRIQIGDFHLELVSAKPNEPSSMVAYGTSADMSDHALLSVVGGRLVMSTYKLDIFDEDYPVIRSMINTFNDFHAVSTYMGETLAYLAEEYMTIVESRAPTMAKLEVGAVGDNSPDRLLFAFLMTGVPDDVLNEWLQDHVNERLVKRWDKTAQNAFSNMRRVIVESSIRAGERLIIMIMILRESSTNEQDAKLTNLRTQELDGALKAVELLVAQLHSLLKAINVEFELFSAFCQWLCFAIARLSPDDEHPETIVPVEVSLVVKYIRHHMRSSQVHGFFLQHNPVEMTRFLELDKGIDTLSPFPILVGPDTPTLKHTFVVLQNASQTMFAKPAESLVQRWRLTDTIKLTAQTVTTVDCQFQTDNETTALYIALAVRAVGGEQDHLYIVRKSSVEHQAKVEICRVTVDLPSPAAFTIQDVKFLDDQEVIILLQSCGQDKSSHLISINHVNLTFVPCNVESGGPVADAEIAGDAEVPAKHRELEAGLHPISLAVNGRKGRRTGLYLLADRQRYTVFDLDDADDDDDGEEDDESDHDESGEQD